MRLLYKKTISIVSGVNLIQTHKSINTHFSQQIRATYYGYRIGRRKVKEYEENELLSETWLPVVEYEGLYEVSNLGRIRSLPHNNTKGVILKQYVNKRNGYCYVSLSKNNKATTKRVHVILMQAFNPCPFKKKGYDKNWTIDHKDGDKANNRFSNLEWCSQRENQLRAYALGINGKSTHKCIDIDTKEVFESLLDAAKSVGGKKSTSVHRVCTGQRSQYRNHRFAFYEDYLNNTIPKYSGKTKKESAKSLWR